MGNILRGKCVKIESVEDINIDTNEEDTANNVITPPEENISTQEDKCIQDILDKYFKDIESDFLPDSIERKVYTQILRSIFKSLTTSLSGIKLEVLGHIITLRIEPKQL